MDYFPPKDARAKWGEPRNRVQRYALYKGWCLWVGQNVRGFNAKVWQHIQTGPMIGQGRCVEHQRRGLKTEAEAVKWCEDQVDLLCRGLSTRDAQQFLHQAGWAIDKLIELGCVEGLEVLQQKIQTALAPAEAVG